MRNASQRPAWLSAPASKSKNVSVEGHFHRECSTQVIEEATVMEVDDDMCF